MSDWLVRQAVAGHPNTSDDFWKTLSKDKKAEVRQMLANPGFLEFPSFVENLQCLMRNERRHQASRGNGRVPALNRAPLSARRHYE
jgi:hypothetical protein